MKLADVRLSSRANATVAAIRGEIDMSNVSELQSVLADATPNSAVGLVLDLSGLQYLDSAGIQLLFRLGSDLRARGQRLLLVVTPDSVVSETFRLAGVTGSLDVTGAVDEALAVLAPEGAAS